MPTIDDLSRRQFQVGDAEPRYELFIAGERWSDHAKEIRYENSEAEGGSNLNFISRRSMRGLENASVELWVGYWGAPLVKYFQGTLKRPMPDPPTFTSTAQALGPFAEMAAQSFGEKKVYSGVSLRFALYDIASRAPNLPRGTTEVNGGEGKILEDVEYLEEVTLLEATSQITEKMLFVQADSSDGKRVYQPKPTPGVTSRTKAIYSPADWAEGGLKFEERYDAAYSKVVVFRRGENDTYEVREEFPVGQSGRFPAPPNRTCYVAEFVGTSVEAKQAAYALATRLSNDEVKFTLEQLPINSNINRYDQISVRDVMVEERDGFYSENYDLLITDGLSLDLTDWTPSYTGEGVRTARTKVGSARAHIPWKLSTGVLDKPGS